MPEDIFVAKSRPEEAVVQPLHTITYVTADRAAVERMLVEGFQLDSTDWIAPTAAEYERLNPYLGFSASDSWEACAFSGRASGRNVQVRVIHVDDSQPVVRPTVDGRYLGGCSIGFPVADLADREKRMAGLGIESSIGVKEMEFTSPTGEVYVSAEIHFLGAENLFVLGVRRPEIFVPVGPMNPELGCGGAAYSACCVDNPEAIVAFVQEVLGFEVRRDVTFAVEPPSGLKLDEGAPERFIQAFAPGSSTGYLVYLDHEEATQQSPAPTYGPPSRGMAMWSFPTAQLDRVYERAQAHGVEVTHGPAEIDSPFLPRARTLLLKDPGGFPIELFETAG